MRTSTLVLALAVLSPSVVFAGTCDPSLFGDQVCDCGCGQVDPDCAGATFASCERSHCGAGQVPWEHSPASCMTSACGDGWVDATAGEVCDDGNALASGGCSADCHAVSAGYTCGVNAQGCHADPVDAGTNGAMDAGTPDAGSPAMDAGTPDAGSPAPDAGTGDSTQNTGGCASAPGLWVLGALGLLLRRR